MLQFTYILPQWEHGDVKSNSSTNLECAFTVFAYRNFKFFSSYMYTTWCSVLTVVSYITFINCPSPSVAVCSCQQGRFLCSSNMITQLLVYSAFVYLLMMFQVKMQHRRESKDEGEWQTIIKFPATYFKVPAGIWLQCVSWTTLLNYYTTCNNSYI